MQYSQDPQLQVMTHGRVDNHNGRGSPPKSEEAKTHIRLPSAAASHQEKEPQECLALKANETYFQERNRAVGNGDLTHKGHTKISHTLGLSAEAVL